jgi:hypothetical protein
MKARLLLLTSCLALVLLVAYALRARSDATEAQIATAAVSAQNGQLRIEVNEREARLRDARKSVAAANRQTADPRRDSSRSADETAKSTANNTPQKTEVAPRLSAKTIIASDPAKRATYLTNVRAQVGLDYGGMFKALRLSPEQIERFKDVEVWLEQERMELQAAIETQGLDPNGPEARKLWADYNNSRTTKKTEALGDNASRYLEYFHTASVRQSVQRLAAPDLVPGQTATADQVERAADILAANSQSKSGGGHGVEPGTVNWIVVREQLKGILSTSQIEWLGLFVEEEAASVRVGQRQAQLTAQFRSKSASR